MEARDVTSSKLVRVMLIVLGVSCIAVAPIVPAADDLHHAVSCYLLLGGIALAAFGMAAPSGRLLSRPLDHPGFVLGSTSKIAGWIALGLTPFLIVEKQWPWVLGAVFALVSSVALWSGWRWAPLPWYAIAIACVVGGVLVLVVYVVHRVGVWVEPALSASTWMTQGAPTTWSSFALLLLGCGLLTDLHARARRRNERREPASAPAS